MVWGFESLDCSFFFLLLMGFFELLWFLDEVLDGGGGFICFKDEGYLGRGERLLGSGEWNGVVVVYIVMGLYVFELRIFGCGMIGMG